MAKKVMAWVLLASAVVAGVLAAIYRNDDRRLLLIVLVLSVQASVFEGINMVILAYRPHE